MRVIVLLLVCLYAAGSTAQDISKKMPQIAPGSTVTMQYNNGDTFTQRFLGKQPFPWGNKSYYVYETFTGQGDQEPNHLVYTLKNGNAVYEMNPYGGVIRYVPHNCAREIGTCSYTRYLPDSNGEHFRRVTAIKPGGYKFSLFLIEESGNKRLQITGRATLDDMGIAKLRVFTVPDEDGFSIRMLRSNYK